MKRQNFSKIFSVLAGFLSCLAVSVYAQGPEGDGKGHSARPLNPKGTVIIDYEDGFEHHKPDHGKGPGGGGGGGEEVDHSAGHFELIGGVWADNFPSGEVGEPVDPELDFFVDTRGFPAGSDVAIENAFSTWDAATAGALVGTLTLGPVAVAIGDGVNTYSLRNLGGGGVLAATFITWNDADNDGNIDPSEQFLEMDVVHNSTVKWAFAEENPKGRWWDVENVAVHEIGHVYGLDHPGDAHPEDEEQTMFASAPPKETKKRDLRTDGDVCGIQSDFLGYGQSGPFCSP